MYLAKYQHLPDFAAFPINVKLLLYFLCKKKHVGEDEPRRKLKINLISSHVSPEGRRLSWERCSAPTFPLMLSKPFAFMHVTGQRRDRAAPDPALW